jgi:thiamine biosynthesis protein ThiS
MNERIEILVNGFKEKVPKDATLSSLISLFNEDDVHLIVEHNGRFIYPQQYASVKVSSGDRIEFLNPNFGG